MKEVVTMYRADRCDGQTIVLRNKKWSRPVLEKMRDEYYFKCPTCLEKVVLKLGHYQSWHFAHRPESDCLSARTNESAEHLKAKGVIYDWLQASNLKPELECYLPELRRRPDICVMIGQKHIVIELQRSNIHPNQFFKRHYAYVDAGYDPVWIGLQTLVPITPLSFKTFTQLDSFLIRPQPVPHSIYFNLSHHQWLISSGFYYLQARKTLQWTTHLPLNTSPENIFIHPSKFTINQSSDLKKRNQFLLTYWKAQTFAKRTKVFLSLTPSEKKMLVQFQTHHLNLNYFPAICNLPVNTQYLIDTPPHLWQSWIVLQIINKSPLNSQIHLSMVKDRFDNIFNFYHFTIRPSTKHRNEIIRQLVEDYLSFLCYFGVLDHVFPGVYEVIHHVTLKKSLSTLICDDDYILGQLKKYLVSK
ncbi:competence protein CoiA [Salipaludibacillus sp. HK11]|uniref:competence protein CoiA n=1 Tax=Salipaludibacillus sp. HK11 TaxID=3394320 RepID=UPI0039FC3D52